MGTALARNNWNFIYDLAPEGGVVLQDVKHDIFSLAKDIRITRIWVDTEYPNGPNLRDYKLGSSDLPVSGAVDVLDPSSGLLKSPSPFHGYTNLFGLRAAFKSKDLYLKGTPNETAIDLEQRYLFGDYGKNPPHEPGAVLDATRLFPLLRFSFPPVRSPSQPYPKYFRADYRLDISLDNVEENAVKTGSFSPGDFTNKAGIFRDREDIPGIIGKAIIAFRLISPAQIFASPPNVDELFQALEKPLKYEIASSGLVRGMAPSGVTKLDTWDNTHIWAAKRGSWSSPVSTPGAFHAFHCHWRWGAVAGDPSAAGLLLPAAGQTQFQGIGWSSSEGGALVDLSIDKQNLQFAITKKDIPDWEAAKNPSEKDFKTLFTSKRSTPDDIDKGDDLVFWLSFEAFRPDDSPSSHAYPWGGTFFVNGFYFGHNQDNTPIALQVGGAYGEAWRPYPGKTWVRRAR